MDVNETLKAAEKLHKRLVRLRREGAPFTKIDADLRKIATLLREMAEKLPEPLTGKRSPYEDSLARYRDRALSVTSDLTSFVTDPKVFVEKAVRYATDIHSDDNLTAHASNLSLSAFTAVRGAYTVAASAVQNRNQ